MIALGVHAFAGGITAGFKDHFNVDTHLEALDLGHDTARGLGVDVIKVPHDDVASWPRIEYDCCFGNPRCSAFSNLTCGRDEVSVEGHGSDASSTADIRSLIGYSLMVGARGIAVESVNTIEKAG